LFTLQINIRKTCTNVTSLEKREGFISQNKKVKVAGTNKKIVFASKRFFCRTIMKRDQYYEM
jgi:hypothetical protein